MNKQIAIVLTATILPNAIRTEHADYMRRRAEYLKAIDFYQKYADVYFLENSAYDLASDADFFKYKNVHIRKFPPSQFYAKGKGYQEFEMLDNWLNTEKLVPSRWIKISGRYLVSDFDKVFAECINENKYNLIIEQKLLSGRGALTDVFYVTSEFYKRCFLGIYQFADDAIDVFIEHVVYKTLQHSDEFRLFREIPMVIGISGSTGLALDITLKRRLKREIRNLLYRFNNKYRIV